MKRVQEYYQIIHPQDRLSVIPKGGAKVKRITSSKIVTLIVLVTILLTSCKPSTATKPAIQTIKIGVPTLMTGWGAPMGADIMAGIGMAVENVNGEGGLLGKQLEIVYADTKNTSAEDCALAAQSLDKAGVVAFFPGAFYGPACAIEFANYQQPLLHATASAEVVDPIAENLKEYGNVFQVSASEEAFGPNAFTDMTQLPYDYPNKKAALLGGDISYDMLIKDGIAKLGEKKWLGNCYERCISIRNH